MRVGSRTTVLPAVAGGGKLPDAHRQGKKETVQDKDPAAPAKTSDRQTPAAARTQRLSASLRDNLKRRKAQQRARDDAAGTEPPSPDKDAG